MKIMSNIDLPTGMRIYRGAGTITLRERYLYKGYLQIAAFDVSESGETLNYTLKRIVYWDPTEPTATRPLAINIIDDGVYFPTVDLTKNVCELVDADGGTSATYDYAPFGAVTAGTPSDSAVPANPLQWSSEVYDSELDLVYYNYRHYSPTLGRFLSRDPIQEQGGRNLYAFVKNSPILFFDNLGRVAPVVAGGCYAGISIYALYAAAALLGLTLCECLFNEMCRKTAARIACESACEAAYRVRCAICDATYPFDETGNKFCKKEASTAYALCLADC